MTSPGLVLSPGQPGSQQGLLVKMPGGWEYFMCKCPGVRRGMVTVTIDLLAILKRIGIERYLLHFVEFSNVHNCDRSSNATRSNVVDKNV